MERSNARNHGGQLRRDLRIADVGEMRFAVYRKIVNSRMKGLVHKADIAVELHNKAIGRNGMDREALVGEPLTDLCEIAC